MKTIPESPQMIRQRRLLLRAPLVVLPLITLVAWMAGVGKETPAAQKTASVGVNTQLPGPRLTKSKWMSKLDDYEKADQDSLLQQSHQLEDRAALSVSTHRYSGEVRAHESMDRLNAVLEGRKKMAVAYMAPIVSPSSLAAASSSPPSIARAVISPPSAGVVPFSSPGATPPAVPFAAPAATTPPTTAPSASQQKQPPGNGPPDSATAHWNVLLDKVLAVERNEKDSIARKSIPPRDPWADTTAALSAVSETNGVLTSGSMIAMRLEEQGVVHGVTLPRNTMIYGVAYLENERLRIRVRSIRCGRMIYPISLEAYDLDGQPGIFVPGSLTRDVSKASTEEALEQVDPAIVDPSLGAQAANAGIRAAKSLLTGKVRQVRVMVRPGYQLLLK